MARHDSPLSVDADFAIFLIRAQTGGRVVPVSTLLRSWDVAVQFKETPYETLSNVATQHSKVFKLNASQKQLLGVEPGRYFLIGIGTFARRTDVPPLSKLRQ